MSKFISFIGNKLDGKRYTLNGVSGVIKYSERQAIYPYVRTVQEITHEADATGKHSVEYQEAKRYLGDDYVSDLTNSESLVNIALACGITETEMLAIM